MTEYQFYTLVYTPNGKTAHLLWEKDSPSGSKPAVCGFGPALFCLWHGTGSQDERETATDRPLCRNCAKWYARFLAERAEMLRWNAMTGTERAAEIAGWKGRR